VSVPTDGCGTSCRRTASARSSSCLCGSSIITRSDGLDLGDWPISTCILLSPGRRPSCQVDLGGGGGGRGGGGAFFVAFTVVLQYSYVIHTTSHPNISPINLCFHMCCLPYRRLWDLMQAHGERLISQRFQGSKEADKVIKLSIEAMLE